MACDDLPDPDTLWDSDNPAAKESARLRRLKDLGGL
jgi:hypothetical protein